MVKLKFQYFGHLMRRADSLEKTLMLGKIEGRRRTTEDEMDGWHHQLLELAQIHVHWVGNAIQPSHPLSSPSSPAFNLPSIRVFSNESVLHIRWTKYWSFSFSISPSNEYEDWFPLGLTGWISFKSKGLSRVFFNMTAWKHQFFSAQSSLWSNSHSYTWLLGKP